MKRKGEEKGNKLKQLKLDGNLFPNSATHSKLAKIAIESSDSDSENDIIILTPLISTTPKLPTTTSYFTSPTKSTPSTSKQILIPQMPLNSSIYSFNTNTIDTTNWPNQSVPYSFLANAFADITNTKSRLEISKILTNLLRVIIDKDPNSLLAVVMLSSNRISPVYEGKEMGIGSSILSKVLSQVGGVKSTVVSKLSRSLGDPGDVAFELKKNIRLLSQPAPIECRKLYSSLLGLCDLNGSGSQAIKTERVKKLLVAATGEESRFLVRTLIGNLRTGAVRLTLLTAIAKAFCLSYPESPSFGITATERATVATIEVSTAEEIKSPTKAKAKGKGKAKAEIESKPKLALTKGTEQRILEERMAKADAVLRMVWARCPNFAIILNSLLETGLDSLSEKIPLKLGIPLQPMLGTPTRSLQEIYTRLSDNSMEECRSFISEFKMDGQRAQIHVAREKPIGIEGGVIYEPNEVNGEVGEVRIWVKCFSRHLEVTTTMFPDLIRTLSILVAKNDSIQSFILDSEVCAISAQNGEVRPFQELSYRSKKNVAIEDIEIRCGAYIFDMMYLNSESLLSKSLRDRKLLIATTFPSLLIQSLVPTDVRYATIQLIPSLDSNEIDKVQEFYTLARVGKAEGLMIKLLDEIELEEEEVVELGMKKKKKILPSTYQPDVRTASWLKLKSDYLEGGGVEVDLVPIAAFRGSGRKVAFWSPIVLGCFDEDSGQYQPVCKVMSGFSDEFYKNFYNRYLPNSETTSTTPFDSVDGSTIRPTVWLQPAEVWEIKGADLTLSPVYTAGMQFMGERGISIRFPRFEKIHFDRPILEATTAFQLSELYRNQGVGKEKSLEEEDSGGEEEKVDLVL